MGEFPLIGICAVRTKEARNQNVGSKVPTAVTCTPCGQFLPRPTIERDVGRRCGPEDAEADHCGLGVPTVHLMLQVLCFFAG